MKPFIIVPDGFDKNLFKQLQTNSNLEVHPESKVDQSKLKELLPKASGLVIRSATTITPDLLELAPNLKLVIRAGEGTDNIDKKACGAKGVKVANTPGANNNSAAEHAIALMMTVLRKTAEADASMKRGEWEKSKFTGVELADKKIGIIGFGRIGQIVAKRLAGFDPEITFFDPMVEKCDLPYAKKESDLKKIFSSCDIISIHVPLMPATKGMITRELLEAMPAHAILINAARGGLVDEEALVDVLKSNKIRGAGFDVFATEPLDANNKLKDLGNLVMTPHLGASTEEAQVRVGQMAVHQLNEFFVNNNLLNEVKA
ncbi:MAG: 3-phosphoglycerate dehydrogenase [Halobacteriovorax sp.]|nr:3-phosphoglycerate dehydrogenase [Halobacteriovorax sp.]